MIFRSNRPNIEIPSTGLYQYITSNPNNVLENKILFIDGTTDEKITFGEFKSKTKRFAAGLQGKAGFKRGNVLAIVSPNQIDYSVIVFGAIAAGGKVVPVNPKYSITELTYQLSASGASIIISHPSCLSTTIEAAKKAKIYSKIFLIIDEEIDGVKPYSTLLVDCEFKPIEYTPEEAKNTTVFLCYSSGTTGKNKAVEITHTNMVANVKQVVSSEPGFNKNNVFMGVVPFHHAYGLTIILHISILLGATTVLTSKFGLSTFCRIVQDYVVDYAFLVPAIIQLLVKNPIVMSYKLSSLRMIISAAAPLGKSLIDDVHNIHGIPVKQAYGLTETSPCISWANDEKSAKGSVGMLIPNVEAKIIADDGRELGYDELGELCVRGPNIMKGYLNNEGATNAAFDKDGFLYTGDAAIMDRQGNLFITDRLKELIKYKCFQVAPAELEEIIISHPVVSDAAVVGVNCEADAIEHPLAYITLKPEYEQSQEISNEIMDYVSNKVKPYKRLHDILFIGKIPKNESGKKLRRILRDKAKAEYVFTHQNEV